MLLVVERLAVLAQRVGLLGYEQLRGLASAGLVRCLPSLELLLQTVLVETFQLFYSVGNAVKRLCFWLWRQFLSGFLFGRRSCRVGQVIEAFVLVLFVSLQFQFSPYNLFEIFVVAVVLALAFF